MNLRQKAISEQKLTYSTGRPCRKGHLSERYSSNGMCIRCLKEHAAEMSISNRKSRIIRNTARINNQTERRFMLTGEQNNTVLEYINLLQQADPDTVARCVAYVHAMHTHHHTLTKYALNELLDFRDGVVKNYEEFELHDHDTVVPYIKLNNNWYDATKVMRVLHGIEQSVAPTPLELFEREN